MPPADPSPRGRAGTALRAAFIASLLLVAFAEVASAATITSDFAASDEGWAVFDTSTGPPPTAVTYVSSGGNPDGFIRYTAGGAESFKNFMAIGAEWTGDHSANYGDRLRFDLRSSAGLDGAGSVGLIDGSTLIYRSSQRSSVTNGWDRDFVPFTETGWRVAGSNALVTQAQFQGIISSLDAVLVSMGPMSLDEMTDLDNAVLATPAAIQRQLSLDYRRRRHLFKGTLFSADPACRGGTVAGQVIERVSIWRVRKGPDRRIGRSVANATGNFKLSKDAARGKYYASVSRRTTAESNCSAAKSPRITVR